MENFHSAFGGYKLYLVLCVCVHVCECWYVHTCVPCHIHGGQRMTGVGFLSLLCQVSKSEFLEILLTPPPTGVLEL